MPLTHSFRTRREFLLKSAAYSFAAVLPQGLAAQENGSKASKGDDPELTTIPRDTRLKFNIDGSQRPFAGNTVVCHLPQQSRIRDAVTALGNDIRTSSFAKKLAILPSDSYHVTILGGVTDVDRSEKEWPRDISVQASISDCNRAVEQRFGHFKTAEELPLRFRLDKEKTLAPQLASGLQLAPADQKEKSKLTRLRNSLADDVFTYRASNHETFGFHISLAYQMRGFTSEEKRLYDDILQRYLPMIESEAPVIELGLPEFCTFEDMYRFEIHKLLKT